MSKFIEIRSGHRSYAINTNNIQCIMKGHECNIVITFNDSKEMTIPFNKADNECVAINTINRQDLWPNEYEEKITKNLEHQRDSEYNRITLELCNN